MRLTMRANLAMRVLMQCAVNHPGVIRASDVAGACNASANHVAQVVSQLAAAGYLRTLRGRGGGIALGRPAEDIPVGQVLRLIEREVPFAECMDGDQNTCPLSAVCRLKGALCRALDAFFAELETVSLADLVRENTGLADILSCRLAPA
ncbi:Rrf2 family transcriptional regulator [Rhodobacter sp. Har01]|uniref:RrF2 family transcriptional regulator n=1 Tax=Rhodobacter sp. Har01 TaxID=2883999 RepID=UPI001D0602EE|nr:Rrf2 family transcriptional regulator [Rhodobacter sp. Har01]MCB6176775.1 Rrf2 family transcriptional regulator [Rhodobacter sp. Har01]